jgi:hypothetical protein
MKRFHFPAFLGFLLLVAIGTLLLIGFGAPLSMALGIAAGAVLLNGLVLLGRGSRKSSPNESTKQ